MRSLRVWVLGLGMLVNPLFVLVAHFVGLGFGLKKGAPLWDLVPSYRVPASPLKPIRLILF